jgi:hypothetical protein
MKVKKEELPNTKFQRWLSKHNACMEGRRKVGGQTVQEFWQSTRRADWMIWLLQTLYPREDHLYDKLGIVTTYKLSTRAVRNRVLADNGFFIQLP